MRRGSISARTGSPAANYSPNVANVGANHVVVLNNNNTQKQHHQQLQQQQQQQQYHKRGNSSKKSTAATTGSTPTVAPASPATPQREFQRRESLVKPTWQNITPGQLSPKTLEKVNGIDDDGEYAHHHHQYQQQHQQQQQQQHQQQQNSHQQQQHHLLHRQPSILVNGGGVGGGAGGGGGGGGGGVGGGGNGSSTNGGDNSNGGYANGVYHESSSSSSSGGKPLLRSIAARRNSDVYDIFGKVMLLGDSGVGKTCLLVRFRDGTFLSGNFISTVGIDFRNKVVLVDSTRVKLQIWDTAGQERFRSVTHAYYRDAHALLLLYDVTNKTSFDNIRAWLVEIREYAQEDVVIMLLGNKADCSSSDRQVKREEGERLAREYNVAFMETSAKTGLNVELAFLAVARQLKCRRNESIDEAKFNVQDFVREQTQAKQTCPQCNM